MRTQEGGTYAAHSPRAGYAVRLGRTRWTHIALFVSFAATACEPDAPARLTLDSGDFVRTVATADGERRFLVHVPPGLNHGAAVPLLVVLHGAGQTPEGVRDLAAFDAEADRLGFVVVYPEGRDRTWRVVGSDRDRDFLNAVVERVAEDMPVDRGRVYAVGLSQGALMTHRMGCSATSPFVAIASVAASLSKLFDNCSRRGPVPAIFFLGSADPIYPWDEAAAAVLGHHGGVGSAAAWANRTGCGPDAVHAVLPDVEDDGVHVEHWLYSSCPFGSVELFGMMGGGHTWPGPGRAGPAGLGRNTGDIDASRLILDFLLSL